MLTSLSSYSTEYLIRYEKQQKSKVELTLSTFGKMTAFDLSFGSFIKLESKKDLTNNDQIRYKILQVLSTLN